MDCYEQESEERMVPEGVARAFEFAVWLLCGDVDVEERKKELKEKIQVTERRLKKLAERNRQRSRNLRGKRRISEKRCNASMDAYNKMQFVGKQLELLRREYAAILAVEMNVPMNFILTSYVRDGDNGDIHFLLGVYDPDIGMKNHGHLIVDKDGNCLYLRLPFDRRGPENFVRSPMTVSQVMAERFSD